MLDFFQGKQHGKMTPTPLATITWNAVIQWLVEHQIMTLWHHQLAQSHPRYIYFQPFARFAECYLLQHLQ
jgi:hypothetical protein